MAYPSRLILGEARDPRLYVLQPDRFVLRFTTTDTIAIETTLSALGLETLPKDVRGPRESLGPDMRVVTSARGDAPGEEFAARVLSVANLPASVAMVSPIYVEEGGGPESAVAPVPGRLLVRFRDGVEDPEKDRVVKEMNLRRAPGALAHLKPFEMLSTESRRPENDRRQGLPMSGEPGGLFELQKRMASHQAVETAELDWLLIYGLQLVPSDTFWTSQWNMVRIGMVGAWDVQVGGAGVVIAVIDSGIAPHPDLALTAAATHFNAAEAEVGPGPYNGAPDPADVNGAHGTLVAGIAAATVNNGAGVAGVAGGCQVMPIRVFPNATLSRVAAGVNWAVAQGAEVVNMSLGGPPAAVVATAVTNAWGAGLVLCAATGNYYSSMDPASAPVVYPAAYGQCIAVGASDQSDQRKRAASADGEDWGSHWGPEIDVVAPGVRLWSTDIPAAAGWNVNGGPITWQGVAYASSGDAAGDYFALMGGTSGATPHVAGLAALLRLEFPTLSNQRVRDIIERTCDKVSPALYPYAFDATHSNGSWHTQMGYGRINAQAALNYCDVMIADHAIDTGVVPSATFAGGAWAPAPFWTYQPYVTTTSNPMALPADHQSPIGGQNNYVHAVVRNNGPANATNVTVSWHIMDYPGTELVYPADWNAGNMIATTTVASLGAGAEVPVEALWPQALVNVAAGYVHPCMVVAATTPADLGGQIGRYVYQHNNIAQHNISFAPAGMFGFTREFTMPFALGHRTSLVRRATVHFDLRTLNGASAYLDLSPNPDNVFVRRILDATTQTPGGDEGRCRVVATEDTRLALDCGCLRTTVVLRAGSSITLDVGCRSHASDKRLVRLTSATYALLGGREVIALHGGEAAVEVPLEPGAPRPMAVIIAPPDGGAARDRYRVDVTQISENEPTGGISFEVHR